MGKEIMALLIAVVMVLAMGVGVSAAANDPAYDSKVSVTNLMEGDVAHFYKIVKWADGGTGDYRGWEVVAPYDNVITDLETVLVGKAAVVDDPATTEVDETADAIPAGISATMAQNLAKAVAANNAGIPITVGSNGIAELDVSTGEGRGAGIYMVLIEPADPDVVYNPVFVSSDYNTDANGNTNTLAISEDPSYWVGKDAAAKKSTNTLKKEAKTTEAVPDDMKWITTAIGDTVDFTVTVTIPGFGNAFIDPFFKVTDKLTDLKLVADSVTIASPAAAAADGAAEITEAADGLSYTILFDGDYLKTVTIPTEVTITYSAIVTETAPLNVNWEKNEVWTEFTNDITGNGDHTFQKDTTIHYTFTIGADLIAGKEDQEGIRGSEIVKVGRKANGDPINETRETSSITTTNYWEGPQEGAHFKLYRNANCTEEYIPKTATGASGTPLDIVSGADGRITIAGLDAGEYWLKEVSCPDGFIMDSHVAHIVISTTETEKDVTEYTKDGITWFDEDAYNNLSPTEKAEYKSYTYKRPSLDSYTITIDDVEAASYKFLNTGKEAEIDWTTTPPVELPHQFTNTEGTQLPATGGVGRRVFIISGSVLLLGAAILLITRRRMSVK